MHIITRRRLREAARKHPRSATKIQHWYAVAKHAVWQNLVDVRKTFRHADPVTLPSGKTVTVFNVSDAYRLVTAIHYDRKKVFILRFLTHAEYDKGKWKETL